MCVFVRACVRACVRVDVRVCSCRIQQMETEEVELRQLMVPKRSRLLLNMQTVIRKLALVLRALDNRHTDRQTDPGADGR